MMKLNIIKIILKNKLPIRDFWIFTGLLVDYMEAFFLLLFGNNWSSHILHASSMNVIASLSLYYFLRKINFDTKFSVFYTLSFATLCYPVSGTPFAYIHACTLHDKYTQSLILSSVASCSCSMLFSSTIKGSMSSLNRLRVSMCVSLPALLSLLIYSKTAYKSCPSWLGRLANIACVLTWVCKLFSIPTPRTKRTNKQAIK